MNDKFERIKNNCFSIASRFLRFHKFFLLVFFIIFFIGFLTGIITCSGFAKDLEVKNLINPYLYDFLRNEMTFFSYFLTLSVFFVLLSLFTIFCVRNKFFIGLSAIILFLLAYIFGFDLCVVIICMGLAGVVLGVIFMGLLGFLIFSLFICILAMVCKRILKDKNCDDKKMFLKAVLCLICLALIILFFYCLFFSLIHIFVIV